MPRQNILIHCVFISLWFYMPSVFAQKIPYPYEQCNWENKDFTDRIVKESQDFSSHKTEAKATCLSCHKSKFFHKNHLNGAQRVLNQAVDIPEICFLAGALSQVKKQPNKYSNRWYYCPGARSGIPRKQMRFSGVGCNKTHHVSCTLEESLDESQKEHFFDNFEKEVDAQKTPWAFAQRPCLSKDYIRMTAKAFNETANCFGFNSKEDKEQLFALMNHQSSFFLNKKAKDKAAGCYGQLGNIHIANINSYIYDPSIHKEYHKIYQDVVKKCPHIINKINLLSRCQELSKNIHAYRKCLLKEPHSDALMCQTSQDPYSCLFYTLYNIKKYELNIKTELADHHDIQLEKKTAKQAEIAKQFKWPIKINEMLVVKGKLVGPITLRVYMGSNTFLNSLKYKSEGKIAALSIKKNSNYTVEGLYKNSTHVIEAFNKFDFQYHSKDFQNQKLQIFDKQKLKWAFVNLAHNAGANIIQSHFASFMKYMKDQIVQNEDYQKTILSGKSLNLSVFNKEFSAYAKLHKLDGQNNPANLLHNVSQGLNNLTNKNKQLEEGIKSIYKFQDFQSKQINSFSHAVREHCPTTLL